MKILVFTDHFHPEPSAPAAHIYERVRIWAANGHAVTVVASAPNFPEGIVHAGYRNAWRHIEKVDGVRVVRVKTFIYRNQGTVLRSLDFLSYLPSALAQSLREERADVVFASTPHLFVPCAALGHGLLRSVPVVTEVRDLWPDSLLGTASRRKGPMFHTLRVIERLIYARSRAIIALTPAIAEAIVSRGIPSARVEVVINGANTDLFRPQSPDARVCERYGLHGRFVVGYIGTVGLAHGLESAIRAFQLLEDSPATLMIVGVGAARQRLVELVETERIRNVVFVARQAREDLPAFWSVCSAALVHLRDHPVFATVVPSKIFDAMAMGLPILYAGPESPGSAIVRDRGAGIVIPPGQPDALAAAVRELMAAPGRRSALGAAGLAAAPEYTRQSQAERTLTVLGRAASRATEVAIKTEG